MTNRTHPVSTAADLAQVRHDLAQLGFALGRGFTREAWSEYCANRQATRAKGAPDASQTPAVEEKE